MKKIERKRKKEEKSDSEKIEELFLSSFSFWRTDLVFSRFYINDYECDILRISNTDMLYEYEIKISVGDFKADFQKQKRRRVKGKLITEMKHDIIVSGERTNYFSFVVDKSLAHLADDVSGLYGFYVVDLETKRVECIRRPKRLHNKKFSSWKKLCKKIFWRNK